LTIDQGANVELEISKTMLSVGVFIIKLLVFHWFSIVALMSVAYTPFKFWVNNIIYAVIEVAALYVLFWQVNIVFT
jgi:hypothetical protein